MLDAVVNGAKHPDIANVDVRCILPSETRPDDIKEAQTIIIGTTENLGYMAVLIKVVFDRCYDQCLENTQGLHFAFYIRAGYHGIGTRRTIESIATGLR